MDLATLTNAPREITLAGKTYMVSALTLKEWGALQAYLKDHAVNPVVAALGQLSAAKAAGIKIADEDRTALFLQAKADGKPWPPMVGSTLWFDTLLATEGTSPVFLVSVIRKHQPEITDAELSRIDAECSADESRLLVYRALGIDPSPKAEPPAGAEAIAPTSPTTGQPPSQP